MKQEQKRKTVKKPPMWSIIMKIVLGLFIIAFAFIPTPDTPPVTAIVLNMFCLAIAVLFLVSAIKSFRLREVFKLMDRYEPIFQHQDSISFEKLMSITGNNSEKLFKELNSLINKGLLREAYLDHNLGRLILRLEVMNRAHEKPPVICGNCGASNIVVFKDVVACEFCGNPLRQN